MGMRRRDFLKTAGAAAAGTGMAGCQTDEDSDGENTTDTPEPTETRQPLKQVGLFLEGEDGGFERSDTLEMGEGDDPEYERQEATVYANVFGGESVDLEVALENGEGEELATFFDNTVEVNDNIEAELDLQYSQIINELELRGGEYEIVVEADGENRSATDKITLELGEPHLSTLVPLEENNRRIREPFKFMAYSDNDLVGFDMIATKLQRLKDPESYFEAFNGHVGQPVDLKNYEPWETYHEAGVGEPILLDDLEYIARVMKSAKIFSYENPDERELKEKYLSKLQEEGNYKGFQIYSAPQDTKDRTNFHLFYDDDRNILVREGRGQDDIEKLIDVLSGDTDSWFGHMNDLRPNNDVSAMDFLSDDHVYACGNLAPRQSVHDLYVSGKFYTIKPSDGLEGSQINDLAYIIEERGERELEARETRPVEEMISDY
jgi:hypothetical protein